MPLMRLRDRQYAPALPPIAPRIETPFASSWKGAAKPDVTLTYFYDYACGYCRKRNPDIDRLMAEDKGLRVVYREFPILGPDSVAAARVALAASKARQVRRLPRRAVRRRAVRPRDDRRGANRLRRHARPGPRSGDRSRAQANMQLAGQLGATGTPLFVVGDRVINSAVGYDQLKEAVATARAKG